MVSPSAQMLSKFHISNKKHTHLPSGKAFYPKTNSSSSPYGRKRALRRLTKAVGKELRPGEVTALARNGKPSGLYVRKRGRRFRRDIATLFLRGKKRKKFVPMASTKLGLFNALSDNLVEFHETGKRHIHKKRVAAIGLAAGAASVFPWERLIGGARVLRRASKLGKTVKATRRRRAAAGMSIRNSGALRRARMVHRARGRRGYTEQYPVGFHETGKRHRHKKDPVNTGLKVEEKLIRGIRGGLTGTILVGNPFGPGRWRRKAVVAGAAGISTIDHPVEAIRSGIRGTKAAMAALRKGIRGKEEKIVIAGGAVGATLTALQLQKLRHVRKAFLKTHVLVTSPSGQQKWVRVKRNKYSGNPIGEHTKYYGELSDNLIEFYEAGKKHKHWKKKALVGGAGLALTLGGYRPLIRRLLRRRRLLRPDRMLPSGQR